MGDLLKSYAEKKALEACNLDAFQGVNLLNIKSNIKDLLELIGRNEIFDEYTKHDIRHIDTMLSLLDYIIPEDTKKKMVGADWLLIVLSIYFHDLGMLVTKREYKEREKSKDFLSFKRKYLENENNKVSISALSQEEQDKFVFQEYVRKNHGERIQSWILGDQKINSYYDNNVIKVIKNLVKDFKPLFRKDIAMLCASHLKDDIDNLDKYKVSQHYGMLPEEKGNVLYAALLLRTADLLHMTSDRTPTVEFQVISPTNPISQLEWAKQSAVSSVSPKIAKDKNGNQDESLPKDTFEVSAYFENEEGFFSLIEYLKYVKEQLKENFRINEIAKTRYASNYDYPWRDIDDSTIETKNFERHQFSFTIDQNKVLKLLVGETLYNNLSVSLRELAQNSIDAVKVKQFELRKKDVIDYVPKIQVYWYSNTRELIIHDNGTGMDLDIIQNHLLKVGSSRYQDTNFQKEHPGYKSISRFGIGLLTCFLIADDVDILTNMHPDEKPLLLKIRNVHGKYLLKHGEEDSNLTLNNETGTSIRLRVRPDVKDFNPLQILKNWILIPNCDFSYIENGKTTKIGYANPHDLIDSVVKSKMSSKEHSSYKVECFNDRGIDLAILLHYNKDMNEWTMVSSHSLSWDDNDVDPLGISIEGIRIDNYTPGFNRQAFVAYANMTGENAPKTNVARSTINGTDVSSVLKTLYGLYFKFIDAQIKNLRKEFSLTWVSDEVSWMLNTFLYPERKFWRDSSFINIDILKESILDLKVVLVEKEKDRYFYSLNDLKEIGHYWTIQSEAFNSANSLIKEIKSANKSVISLFSLLYGDEKSFIKDHDIVLCKNRFPKLLDEVLLSNFQISEISLVTEQRRLDLKWELISKNSWIILKDNDYNDYMIRKRSFKGGQKSLVYIIQKDGNVKINNADKKYDAIHSSYGTIIPLGSKLSDYLIKTLNKFDLSKDQEYRVAYSLCIFFEIVLSCHITEKKELENLIEKHFEKSDDYEFYEFVFRKISENELIEICLEGNFNIYDPTKWYRKYSDD